MNITHSNPHNVSVPRQTHCTINLVSTVSVRPFVQCNQDAGQATWWKHEIIVLWCIAWWCKCTHTIRMSTPFRMHIHDGKRESIRNVHHNVLCCFDGRSLGRMTYRRGEQSGRGSSGLSGWCSDNRVRNLAANNVTDVIIGVDHWCVEAQQQCAGDHKKQGRVTVNKVHVDVDDVYALRINDSNLILYICLCMRYDKW